MRYLITGGAGFIGSNTVISFINKNLSVKVIDNFLTGSKSNLESSLGDIELIEGDICSYKTCNEALKYIDAVIHLAALPSVPRSISNPLKSSEINILGTLNILKAAEENGIRRVIFASSSSIYGDSHHLPKIEGQEGTPLSPYATTKIAAELFCKNYSQLFDLSTVCLRYFNVFGPRQNPKSQYAAAIPNFISKMLKGERPIVYGDGEQSRDFTFVENVVDANLLAATTGIEGGQSINIACGERIKINTVIEKINAILETDIKPIYKAPRPGDIRHSFADISKAKKLLNYQPKIGFDEGLKKTIQWYRKMSGAYWDLPEKKF